MLRVTDPQLENLMFLRDVTIPWMRENPERVDFEMFNSHCGTYGCLLGWYAAQRHNKQMEQISNYPISEWAPVEFGVGSDGRACIELFGTDAYGTLDDRARYLDELIEQRLAALEVAA